MTTILAALAIGFIAGRWSRGRRRGHEPRLVRLLLAEPRRASPGTLLIFGGATIWGKCPYCNVPIETCDEVSVACRGAVSRREIHRDHGSRRGAP